MANERFMPIEVFNYTAVSADEATDKHVFSMDYKPSGFIAQVFSKTSGAINNTGLTVVSVLNTTTKKYDLTVSVTTLGAGDLIHLIAW